MERARYKKINRLIRIQWKSMKIDSRKFIVLLIIPLFGCASNLIDAARKGDIHHVKKHLNANIDVNASDRMGNTALMHAAANGHYKVVKLLLDNGADVNLINYRGGSALNDAASSCHLKASKLLIDSGANINACQSANVYTPFISATRRCNRIPSACSDVMRLLFYSGADINAVCAGTTALDKARNAETYRFINNLKEERLQFGWLIGISDKNGMINHERVRQKTEELKAAPVSPKKMKFTERCRELGGDPTSCTGKIFTESNLPVMGGEDCVICNYQIKQEKCYSTSGEVPCQQVNKPFTAKDNGDGTVTDTNTGLIWQNIGAYLIGFKWQEAVDYCNTLDFAGYSNWRLPTLLELQSIVEPSTKPIFSGPFSSHHCWSDTQNSNTQDSAWFVDFHNGVDGRSWKNARKNVRCVCEQ